MATMDNARTYLNERQNDFGNCASRRDVKYDGYDDVIIGSTYNETERLYVFRRLADGQFRISPPLPHDYFGTSFQRRETSPDGYDDVIVVEEISPIYFRHYTMDNIAI
jgi:hypothetical protein